MLSTNFYIVSGAVDDLPASSDPNYQNAVLCLMLRKTLEGMDTEGFDITRPEISDFTTYRASLTSWLDDAYDREAEIIRTGTSEIVANLPDILTIGAAYISGGASAAIGCVIEIMLKRLLGGDSGAVAANEGQTAEVDFTELIAKLEELREQMAAILTEFNINILRDEEEATFSVGFPEEPA